MNYSMYFAGISTAILLSACAPEQKQQQPTWQTFAQDTQSQQLPYTGEAATNPLSTAAELGLVNILVGQLGISPQQALGGVGSIFSVAQQHMTPRDFSQLSNSVPGMDRYLSSIPQQATASNSSSLLGLMGGQSNALGNLAALAGSFQSLGMNTSMIGQFVPVLLQYVQGQGGIGTMSLLERALY